MAETRREGSGDGTRREAPAGGGTRREAASGGTRREGATARGTRREGAANGGDWNRVNLPPELARRFPEARQLHSGAEGTVLWVEDAAGDPFVVKLYNPGLDFDERAAALLMRADPAHVVRLVEPPGEAPDGSRYEVLEWCEFGSLRDRLVASRDIDVTALVAELSEALTHIHGLRLDEDADARLVHQDLKPDNVLVRSLVPFDLVLGDFGLARMIAGSRHFTNRQQGSRPWAPPSGEAISPGWDWWSLGMIVTEVVAGGHPFFIDGQWMSDAAISDYLSQNSVDLSGVTDERARRLCQGLLTRRTADRWGAGEVRRWLAGDDVPVASDAGNPTRVGPRRTVVFAGVACHSAADLALAFLKDWDQAQERVIQRTDGGALNQQVALLVAEEGLKGALALLQETSGPPARLANLLVEMNPHLPPTYRGKDLRPTEVARRLADPSTLADEVRLIEDAKYGIIQAGILHCWRSLEGMGSDVERRLEEARAFLRNQKPTLDRLSAGGTAGTSVEKAKAAVYLAAVLPASAHTARQRLAEGDTGPAREQAWWRSLADVSGDYAPALALATQPLAREQTERARAARKAAEDAARRAEEAARREERARQRAERQRRVDTLRSADIKFLLRVGFLLVPAAGVGVWRIDASLEPDAGPTQELGALFEAAPWAIVWGALGAGAFVALAIGALVLLRRGRFGDRPVGMALAVALAIGAAVSFVQGPQIIDDAKHNAAVAMFTNPVPHSRIDTCDNVSVWTNESAGTRAFADQSCKVVRGYAGWFEKWSFASDRPIGQLASLGSVYLVTDESSERVIALDEESGARLWEKTCPVGITLDESMFDAGDDTPSDQVVAGDCDGTSFRLDPLTGTPV